LLFNQIQAALQPTSPVVYLAIGNDQPGASAGVAQPDLQTIPCAAPAAATGTVFE
jgi:hypothetical protein